MRRTALSRIYILMAGLMTIQLSATAHAASPSNTQGWFDDVPTLTAALEDGAVAPASCCEPTCAADDCFGGCSDCCGSACCGSDACCGMGCGDVCGMGCGNGCGACCGGGCPCCAKNCGLFGQGLFTYDPCDPGCPLPELLLGCFCPTERCFDDFISPMTNPVFFEDPRNVTEMRGIFLNHRVPGALGGGDIQLYAMQLRARLTERMSLIAAKDGFIVSENPAIRDGWADVDVGLKYALLRDVANQRLVSVRAVYDLPVGSPRALQAGGDGEFHLFVTGGTQLGDCAHWVSAFGGIIPVDDDANSSFVYWSNHWDYQVRRGWYAVAETNWYHWTEGGNDRLGLTGIEGGDLFNFGSGGVGGNDIVTQAFGMKYKPNRKTELGIAWEFPLTDRRDVLDNRLTVDAIFRY